MPSLTSSPRSLSARLLSYSSKRLVHPPVQSDSGVDRRSEWVQVRSEQRAVSRRSGQVFFVAALIAILVAIGFATTASTHVLERATVLQQADSTPAVVERGVRGVSGLEGSAAVLS